MKIIKLVSIWNPKGGQGKSTLAINLAAASVELGLKPLIICQDPQGTSLLYYKSGNLPFEVVDSVPTDRPDADIVIFDHQASDWEVPKNHLIVMPLKPARDQYATYIDAYRRAELLGKKIITVVTDGQEHRANEKDTIDYLKSKGACVIPSSGVFSRAASEYITIFDQKMNKAYKIRERRMEINKILAAILIENEETKNDN
ncbi:chromosome partitioning protein ParA (plasmid) [Candidatus Megaera polyxenophila]|jgi:chromosome partitioning protein|uniref:ParA family protein n=1 Tax=Candidatus Megaera polyxenophila TaxID=988779 RepID=UPI001D80811F|nr:ParA family protein [Alphaproteobacteria bacterium]UCM94749.1 MAG: ParA family protein [Candidatus Megaira endosymbiont of Mesostigma viride]WHA07675.1 ParA family protein [Candidatus Megaera polyxenophila]NDE19049.1 ParA family protein [Alphaproteobacteria bacterium]BBB57525.1 chromosome partitioning protein ParA [Candidatus Megaera polyxenophila]